MPLDSPASASQEQASSSQSRSRTSVILGEAFSSSDQPPLPTSEAPSSSSSQGHLNQPVVRGGNSHLEQDTQATSTKVEQLVLQQPATFSKEDLQEEEEEEEEEEERKERLRMERQLQQLEAQGREMEAQSEKFAALMKWFRDSLVEVPTDEKEPVQAVAEPPVLNQASQREESGSSTSSQTRHSYWKQQASSSEASRQQKTSSSAADPKASSSRSS